MLFYVIPVPPACEAGALPFELIPLLQRITLLGKI